MTESKPAVGPPQGGADLQAPKARPQWDKSEWDAKAKQKDAHYAEQAKARDEALQQVRKFKPSAMDNLPEATESLKQRTDDLGLEKNLNKTMIVTTTAAGNGKGPRGPGFYCDLCDRTLKDSLSYLDHVNSRYHLRHLGQTTQVTRSTLLDVRRKIASLRAQTAEKVNSKNFDFAKRLEAIRENEAQEKAIRKEDRKRKRAERRDAEGLGRIGLEAGAGAKEREDKAREMQGLEGMLGFSGFGGGKKR